LSTKEYPIGKNPNLTPWLARTSQKETEVLFLLEKGQVSLDKRADGLKGAALWMWMTHHWLTDSTTIHLPVESRCRVAVTDR